MNKVSKISINEVQCTINPIEIYKNINKLSFGELIGILKNIEISALKNP